MAERTDEQLIDVLVNVGRPGHLPAYKKVCAEVLQRKPAELAAFLTPLAARLSAIHSESRKLRSTRKERNGTEYWRLSENLRQRWVGLNELFISVTRRKLPLTAAQVVAVTRVILGDPDGLGAWTPMGGAVIAAENYVATHGLTPEVRPALERLAKAAARGHDFKRHAERLARLLAPGPVVKLDPGEAWSDAALADLKAMPPAERDRWRALLAYCQTAIAGTPTAKWLKAAEPLVQAVGHDAFRAALLRWFPLVDRPRTQPLPVNQGYGGDPNLKILPEHAELLKGLVWCSARRPDAELARALGNLAVSAYRKLPGVGARQPGLGNACVWALGAMPGREAVGQLAILKTRAKTEPVRKAIERALKAAAAREGLPPDEIEELAVPTCGLQEVGRRRDTFGEHTAELAVDGSTAALHWSQNGKPLKAVPAAVKTDHAAELKELQTAVKDVQKLLTAQRDRLDGLFLQRRTWPVAAWRERYLDHPLVGPLARRLIWSFDGAAGLWHDGRLVGSDDRPLTVKARATVALWHPLDQPTDDVLAWRAWLERHEVRQPFKQAHREIYVLTAAERQTRTYSNRFAAHVLRQHQVNALAAARGWQSAARVIMNEGGPEPAVKRLPAWDLRAEFWVAGIGDEPGVDTNAAGSYLHLTTDQVRFYPLAGDRPLPLADVPPLVFSEVMRDVDLFVGVGSVGNDPTWADGGPQGRHRDAWQHYSFGELSGTAQTRRTLLERLVPRLKIAERCSFADRFLVVRGDRRTYKIHLGSGNILMAPDDQYLCIVPKPGGTAGDRVFLPFEGDHVLSVILSKAFLLADDTKITDPTITRQLAGR